MVPIRFLHRHHILDRHLCRKCGHIDLQSPQTAKNSETTPLHLSEPEHADRCQRATRKYDRNPQRVGRHRNGLGHVCYPRKQPNERKDGIMSI